MDRSSTVATFLILYATWHSHAALIGTFSTSSSIAGPYTTTTINSSNFTTGDATNATEIINIINTTVSTSTIQDTMSMNVTKVNTTNIVTNITIVTVTTKIINTIYVVKETKIIKTINTTSTTIIANGSGSIVTTVTDFFNETKAIDFMNTTTSLPTLNNSTTICTSNGFLIEPNSKNCTTYIECVENDDGTYTNTVYKCPDGYLYNPNTTFCDDGYQCPTSEAIFSCKSAGRFAKQGDVTCQSYYYCVLLSNGTYLQYEYTCPSTSVFDPTRKICTTSYICKP